MNITRRLFVSQIAAIPAALLAAKSALADTAPFDFLVVGDSLVWGQGLPEADKFYELTREWLGTEAYGGDGGVRMKVKAHSGATLKFHEEEEAAFKRIGRDPNVMLDPEINVGFPSIEAQLENAVREYADPRSVKLIMVSGGITDISVAGILNPFGKNDQLVAEIDKYCGVTMTDILRRAAELFPEALVAVIGYYPMISSKTPTHAIFNFALEAYGSPRFLKPMANNVVTRHFLRQVGRKAVRRSTIWAERSRLKLMESIDAVNTASKSVRAVYIETPITTENTYGTNGTLVFRMLKKGRIEDAMFDHRQQVCTPALKELNKQTGFKYRSKFCDYAAVGHPNPAGSRAYAEIIKTTLRPLLNERLVK